MRRSKKRLIVYIIALFQVMGLLSAVHAVMSTRTPQGAIAWTVSLVTFPYIAVPAYWVFGRSNFHGYVQVRGEELQEIAGITSLARTGAAVSSNQDIASHSALRAAEKLARIPLTNGNDVELLIDGSATFTSIFEGIDAATDYILVQFYIVHDDVLGNDLKSRLIAAAARGVRVYFLYDEIGSLGLSESYGNSLREGGVLFASFNTRKGSRNRFQINFRNHRKIVVVDGQSAWIGGHNVGDEYLGKDPETGRWRDTHMRINGPATLGAQLSFAEDWHWATDDKLLQLNWSPKPVSSPGKSVLVVASGPADNLETASLMFTHALNSATRRIWIASPYFVPDDAVVNAIQLAGLRGVDVRILIPDKSDSLLVQLSAWSYLDEVSATGARFYRYQDGFLHEKVFLIDDEVSAIGTANFDNRSFRLNFEVTALTIDKELARDVEAMFERDFGNSREMPSQEFDQKPYWFKLAVKIARLTAPVQ